MKLWQFCEPYDYRYARAGRHGGTWQAGEPWRRVKPLTIEWLPDSDVVGDFTWPGLNTDIVITDPVAKVLKAARVTGFELGTVEMVESSKATKRASRKKQVALPYTGPQLWDLWVTAWTPIDRERSTVTAIRREDGSESYEISGVQRVESTWDQQRMELVTTTHPRIAGQGLFVPFIRGIFRVEEFPGCVLCTDDVKELIEQHGFTNVSFLEMGDVLD